MQAVRTSEDWTTPQDQNAEIRQKTALRYGEAWGSLSEASSRPNETKARQAMMGPLGRKPPTDWQHYEKYPLTLAKIPSTATPVVLGVNWYSNFDEPQRIDGRWWIGRGNLGYIRGGHCVCIRPVASKDSYQWWKFYDQGTEGACVGFGTARALSLMNRERYDGFYTYREAQKVDEWPGEDYEGTSVRAGCEILRTTGPSRVYARKSYPPDPVRGIERYEWAASAAAVLATLAQDGNLGIYDNLEAVPILNSWGTAYPHVVWMPLTVLDRLIGEEGEAAILFDK